MQEIIAICSIRRLQAQSPACEVLECRNKRWHFVRGAVISMFAGAGIGILDVGRVHEAVCPPPPAQQAVRKGLLQEHRRLLDTQQDQLVFCRNHRLVTRGSRCLFYRFLAAGRTPALETQRQQHTRLPRPQPTCRSICQHSFLPRPSLRTGGNPKSVHKASIGGAWQGSPFHPVAVCTWRPVSASMSRAVANGRDAGIIITRRSCPRGEGG